MAVDGRATVLVLRALGIGDLVTAVPALRALRAWLPDSRIVLAAPEALAELLPLTGAVDALWPTAGLRSFHWPGPRPEVAVNLHGRGPESLAALRSTATPCLLTHAHPSHPDLVGPEWIQDQHEVRRWRRMLEFFGIPVEETRPRLAVPEGDGARSGAAVVHPGASHAARQWPPQRFAEVARRLVERGYDVVVTGNAAERELAERVAASAGLPADSVVAGRTGLRELAALVAGAGLVVCADTGMAHLATAFATPSVVLFGPVAPRHWGPPDDARHAALWAGRLGDTFADRPDPGLLRLSVEDVVAATDRVLAAAPTPRATPSGGER